MTRNHTPSIGERVRAAMNPEAPEGAFDPTACRAAGCPCTGTVDLGSSGRFLCAWHAWAPPDRSDAVTLGLRREQALIDLIGELQAMQREGRKGSPWIARARQAWAGDEAMLPTEHEARHWGLYLWRLREELAHRIGLRDDAPQPRARQCDEPQFAPMFRAYRVEGEEVAA